MHFLAERVIVEHLRDAGLVIGELKELNENRIGQLFFPHGLGHLLVRSNKLILKGLRVHDVGGYNKKCPPRL
jgi:Xaa-Pro dipeptidase